MISGNLQYWRSLSGYPQFERAFAFLRDERCVQLAPGRHEIDGEQVFAIVAKGPTKAPAEGRFETHRRYADVQFIVSGREIIGVACAADLESTIAYDAERDVEFYATPASYDLLRMSAGRYAVLFPEDAHMPSCADGGVSEVHKIVVKVRLAAAP